jgi:hypothetical protein
MSMIMKIMKKNFLLMNILLDMIKSLLIKLTKKVQEIKKYKKSINKKRWQLRLRKRKEK